MPVNHDLMGWYTAAQAAKLSGMSPALLNYVCRHDIVPPSCACMRGRGSARHYSFSDLIALRLISRLAASGISFLRLKKGLAKLREVLPPVAFSALPASHLVTDGESIYWRHENELLERTSDGQFVFAFVVELEQLRNELVGNMTQAQRAALHRLAS